MESGERRVAALRAEIESLRVQVAEVRAEVMRYRKVNESVVILHPQEGEVR